MASKKYLALLKSAERNQLPEKTKSKINKYFPELL